MTSRLHVKIGVCEFESEGRAEVVAEMFVRWALMVARHYRLSRGVIRRLNCHLREIQLTAKAGGEQG